MKNLTKLLLAAIVCCTLTVFFTSVSLNDWQTLGEKKVNLSLESDVMKVGANEGRFTTLKFKVEDQAIFLLRIKVTYGNGESDLKVIKQRINEGSESKLIDLPGNKRVIKSIRFFYKSAKRATTRAKIIALGK